MNKAIRILAIMAAILLVCLLATSCGEKPKTSGGGGGSAESKGRDPEPDTSEEGDTSSDTSSEWIKTPSQWIKTPSEEDETPSEEVKPSSEQGEASSEEPGPSSEEPGPSSEEPEPSSEEPGPTAPEAPEGGVFHKSFELTYYLPDFLLAMKYNGMLGVYEFYTGSFNGSPTGLDFAVEVYDIDELRDEPLETYVLTRSRAAAAGLKDIELVEYNGYTWLRLTNGSNATYYYATFGDYLYCILTLQGYDTAENYLTTRDMLEQTLFFSAE